MSCNHCHENVGEGPKACERLDAAYEAMKTDQRKENYLAMLQALEADLREDAGAFMRVETKEDVEALRKEGKIRWLALESPKGSFLPVFTSARQASKKKPAAATIGVSLLAFFKVLAENEKIAGFVVNPLDDGNGFLLDRANLERVLQRAKGVDVKVPPLDPRIVSEACANLFACAVGVPTPVYEFEPEIGSLGGTDAIMRPIQEKWQKAVQSGAFRPATPAEYVKTIAKDAMTTGFVSGALAKRGVDFVRSANPEECVDRVPYLKDDLVQNTDEYMIALCELVRARTGTKDENALWIVLANSIGIVAFGAMNFGFGWGLAKCCESEGEASLKALKARQRTFLDRQRKFAEAAAHRSEAPEPGASESV